MPYPYYLPMEPRQTGTIHHVPMQGLVTPFGGVTALPGSPPPFGSLSGPGLFAVMNAARPILIFPPAVKGGGGGGGGAKKAAATTTTTPPAAPPADKPAAPPAEKPAEKPADTTTTPPSKPYIGTDRGENLPITGPNPNIWWMGPPIGMGTINRRPWDAPSADFNGNNDWNEFADNLRGEQLALPDYGNAYTQTDPIMRATGITPSDSSLPETQALYRQMLLDKRKAESRRPSAAVTTANSVLRDIMQTYGGAYLP